MSLTLQVVGNLLGRPQWRGRGTIIKSAFFMFWIVTLASILMNKGAKVSNFRATRLINILNFRKEN